MFLKMFKLWDDCLIEQAYQPMADWFGTLFGINQFSLSKICLYLSGAVIAVGFYLVSITSLVGVLSASIIVVVWDWLGRKMRDSVWRVEKYMHSGAPNINRVNYAGRARLHGVVLFALYYDATISQNTIQWWCFFIGWILYFSVYYFAACDWPTLRFRRTVTQGNS